MGPRTRVWLFLGTVLQALFTMAAALLLWKGGQSSFSTNGPTWTNPEGFAAIAFISASMGLQGIMGKRVNTEFATTSASEYVEQNSLMSILSSSRVNLRMVRTHGRPQVV